MKIVGGIFCVLIATCSQMTSANLRTQARDIEQLRSTIRNQQFSRKNLFLGLSVESVRIQSFDGQVQETLQQDFSQLSSKVWRCTTRCRVDDSHKFQTVMTRDDDFLFDAIEQNSAGFQYRRLGYDQPLKTRLRRYWQSKFPFGVAPLQVMGTPVEIFLESQEVNFQPVTSADPLNGRRVYFVEFEFPNRRDRIFGRLQWLPDHAGLLTRIQVFMSRTSVESGKPEQLTLSDVKIDYREFDGRLLPCRIEEHFDNGRATVNEVSSLKMANQDRQFYTAEALGLETPRQPRARWRVWALIATGCLITGLYFRKGRAEVNPVCN